MPLHYLLFSTALFAIGAYGVLARRNLLIVLMSLELMLNGVNVALVTFALRLASVHGHVFVLMVMAVAAAEVAVGLAIVIALFRTRQTVDTNDLQSMGG
ncbi:MAG: NADH-quinone oxidoreductase subunit NuoK [Myxococcota bacterium]